MSTQGGERDPYTHSIWPKTSVFLLERREMSGAAIGTRNVPFEVCVLQRTGVVEVEESRLRDPNIHKWNDTDFFNQPIFQNTWYWQSHSEQAREVSLVSYI